jgi:hypothetical protein
MRVAACASIEPTSHDGSLATFGTDFIDMLFVARYGGNQEEARPLSHLDLVIRMDSMDRFSSARTVVSLYSVSRDMVLVR